VRLSNAEYVHYTTGTVDAVHGYHMGYHVLWGGLFTGFVCSDTGSLYSNLFCVSAQPG